MQGVITLIFEQEVSIFNPNALHSRFTRFNTQIQQTSRNIALIATKEELLESSVSGKSFLETSKGYVDVRADSITSMVQARRLGGKNLLYNTGNPTNPNDVDTTGMTQEEQQEAISEATRDSYKYLVAGENSFTSIENSTYWDENVFSRTMSSSSGAIYSSRARLKNPDNLYVFSCDFRKTNGVSTVEIYLRYDTESQIRTGTGYVTDMLLYDSELGIDGIQTLSYEEDDGNGGTNTNSYSEGVYKRSLTEYATSSSEQWEHIEIPFIIQEPHTSPYPNSGYIYFYVTGSNGSKFLVTHLQLEKGGVATAYDGSLEEAMEETYSKIEQTADSITTEVGSVDGRLTTVESNLSGLTTRVQNAEGDISTVTQTANRIDAGFNGNNILSLINDRNNTTATISADAINMNGVTTFLSNNGYVTEDDLGANGSTVIDGGRISTNTLIIGASNVNGLASVATSGSYNDLSNKPTIPDVSGYIAKDGTIGTLPASGATSSNTTGFKVSSQGLMTASNAIIYGTTYSSSGIIGGWTLESNNLHSGTGTSYVGLDSNTNNTYAIYAGNSTASSAPFRVTRAGKLYATDAEISGNITANSLTLGSGVTIASSNVSGLSSVATSGSYSDLSNKPTIPDTSIFIAKDGTIGNTPSDGATGFKVSSAGLLEASNAIIYGTIYSSAGRIGNFNIENNDIISYNTIISDGNSNSSEFYVQNYYTSTSYPHVEYTSDGLQVEFVTDVGLQKGRWAFSSRNNSFWLNARIGKIINHRKFIAHDENGNDVTSQVSSINERVGNFGVNTSGDVYCQSIYTESIYTKNINGTSVTDSSSSFANTTVFKTDNCIQVSKMGKMGYVGTVESGAQLRTSISVINGGYYTLSTIPSGFRPIKQHTGTALIGSSYVTLRITTGGEIQVYLGNNVTMNADWWVHFNLSYIVEDED